MKVQSVFQLPMVQPVRFKGKEQHVAKPELVQVETLINQFYKDEFVRSGWRTFD